MTPETTTDPEMRDESERRLREQLEIGDDPHVDGLTRGTVIEYDDWQWAVVTELAVDHEPPRLAFVPVDDLGDHVTQQLETAWGCLEHYEAVEEFRDTAHEYWTDIEYVETDDIWEVIGPIHPDKRHGGDDE